MKPITMTEALEMLATRINAEHNAYIAAHKKGLAHAMRAGKLLMQAKELLEHGEWLPWLEQHCPGVSVRTVQLYMRLARGRATIECKYATVAYLTLNQADALLAPDPPDESVPEPVQADALLAPDVSDDTEPMPVSETTTSVHFSSETDNWATPQDFFDRYNAKHHFEIDVCATAENAKCARFFTVEDDGLSQPWTGTCWMNPPYGREIGRWMAKAWESFLSGATVVCLVPARTVTTWWHDYCTKGEIEFIQGRLRFGGSPNSAPFPSAVVVFDGSWDGRPFFVKRP
jgi:phage N-6-adenine-methyltransferase